MGIGHCRCLSLVAIQALSNLLFKQGTLKQGFKGQWTPHFYSCGTFGSRFVLLSSTGTFYRTEIKKTVVALCGDDDCEDLLSVPRIIELECAINYFTELLFRCCFFVVTFFFWHPFSSMSDLGCIMLCRIHTESLLTASNWKVFPRKGENNLLCLEADPGQGVALL